MTDTNKGGIFFIINPISGNGNAGKSLKMIRRFCEKRQIRYAFHETSQPGDGATLSRKGIACGFDTIVAVGGDGTVNEVGRELIGSEVGLGIMPAGSGNGLARHMGIPMNLHRAIRRIHRNRKVRIDTATIDDHVFLNMAGIGFDAHVSKGFAEASRRGWYNYLKIILRLSTKIERFNVTVESDDGRKEEHECVMLSMANSAQYGNNAKIAPKADIADGKLDICILKPINFMQAMLFLIKVMTGMVRNNKHFTTFKSKSLIIKGGDELAHIDGDPVNVSRNIEVKVNSKSLTIIC